RAQFARGECDLILTTEDAPDAGGVVLAQLPLVWIGAPGGQAWRQRPLPLAFEPTCIFRAAVQGALDAAAIPWASVGETEVTRAVEAAVAADLAVHVMVEGSWPGFLAPVPHGGALPALPRTQVILYGVDTAQNPVAGALADMLRAAYCCLTPAPAAAP
ncbi:MAG: LysR family transcriptional regulator, partial [Gemmobacter sp.]